MFTRLRTDLSEAFHTQLTEKPPASSLVQYGGTLEFADYHPLGDCHQVQTESVKISHRN
jgi:hypothetical protein